MDQKIDMESIIILKIGGNVIDNPEVLKSVLLDFTAAMHQYFGALPFVEIKQDGFEYLRIVNDITAYL